MSANDTMTAVGFYDHGSIDNLQLVDVPRPEIGRNDVLVDVKATSLNHHDVFTVRELEDQPDSYPYWPGMDFAGVVVEVGEAVEKWAIGDRVLSIESKWGHSRTGAFCEFVDANENDLIELPPALEFDEAAAIPVAGGTAYKALMKTATIQGDDDVLVIGATGGVGTYAVQIANEIANVRTLYATTSTEEKASFLRDLGVDHTINYVEKDFDREIWNLTDKRGVDVVYNCVGGETWIPSLRSLKQSGGGRLVTSGATAGPNPHSEIRLLFTREIQVHGSNGWTEDCIRKLASFVADGRIESIVQGTYPLEEYQTAFEKMINRDLYGKVVLVQD